MNYNVSNPPLMKERKAEADCRKVLPVCFFCSEVPEGGLKSGFFLKGIFICCECEKKLLNSSPEEKEEYMLTIAKLRNIIFREKSR